MSWQVLEVPYGHFPRLLVYTRFSVSGYTVKITDLITIWAETLNRDGIIGRASEYGCAIDPGDDNNLQVLLDKVQGTLQSAEATTFRIRTSDQEGDLELHLDAPLPRPLAPLRWIIKLVRLDDVAIGVDLVCPLLTQAHNLQRRMTSLIEEIAIKDRIISKITDRLETSGNDLTVVFPGVSKVKRSVSRQKSQRAQLADHVRGLGDFDEASWMAHLHQSTSIEELDTAGLNSILGGVPVSEAASDAGHDVPRKWWRTLGRYSPNTTSKSTNLTSMSGSGSNASSHVNDGEGRTVKATSTTEASLKEIDFERQHTPPGRKLVEAEVHGEAITRGEPEAEDADSTEDEDDLDASFSPSTDLRSRDRTIPRSDNKNVIEEEGLTSRIIDSFNEGDAGTSPRTPEPEGEALASSPVPRAKLGMFGGSSKIELTSTKLGDSSTDANSNDTTHSQSKPRARLGTFGGKQKAAIPSGDEVPRPQFSGKSRLGTFGGRPRPSPSAAAAKPSEPEREENSTEPSDPTSRLGTFREKGAMASSSASTPEAERSTRTPEVMENNPEPIRETSEERIARRRNELKKLETAKGPAKKKRKF